MADKDKSKAATLTPPAVPGPDATEADMRKFEEEKREYEQARHEAQVEAAEKSPQTEGTP